MACSCRCSNGAARPWHSRCNSPGARAAWWLGYRLGWHWPRGPPHPGSPMHWIALQPGAQNQTAAAAPPASGLPDVWSALAWWALQFTPRVVRLEDALLLEVSGSERLWGGRAGLRQLLFEEKKPPVAVRHAYGATSLAAKARLLPGLLQTPAPELPLAALAAARPHLATLAALGCTRWGELRALPRAGVARRFGAPLLQALDQACGQGPDSYPWLLLPEVFEARLELAAQVETAPALLFGARRLLEQLQYWLQLRQQAVLALVLCWTMDARRDTASQGELLLRCAEPSCDTAHLQRLLAEHLARITPASASAVLAVAQRRDPATRWAQRQPAARGTAPRGQLAAAARASGSTAGAAAGLAMVATGRPPARAYAAVASGVKCRCVHGPRSKPFRARGLPWRHSPQHWPCHRSGQLPGLAAGHAATPGGAPGPPFVP